MRLVIFAALALGAAAGACGPEDDLIQEETCCEKKASEERCHRFLGCVWTGPGSAEQCVKRPPPPPLTPVLAAPDAFEGGEAFTEGGDAFAGGDGPSCASKKGRDSKSWHRKDAPTKTCAWVERKPTKRCRKKGATGARALTECVRACASCPSGRGGDATWSHTNKKNKEIDCVSVARNAGRRCALPAPRRPASGRAGVGCGNHRKKKCKQQTGCTWKRGCKDDKAKSCGDLFKKYDKKKEQGKMKEKDEKKRHRAFVAEDRTGRPCQYWTSQQPNAHTYLDTDYGATDQDGDGCAVYQGNPSWCGLFDDDDFSSNDMCFACGGGNPYPNAGLGDHNFCRNPDGKSGGAWCFNADADPAATGQSWDYCDVPQCNPNCDLSPTPAPTPAPTTTTTTRGAVSWTHAGTFLGAGYDDAAGLEGSFAVSGDGRAVVYGLSGGNPLRVRERREDGSWTSPQLADCGAYNCGREADISRDGLVVAGSASKDWSGRVVVHRRPAGGAFETSVALEGGAFLYPKAVALSADGGVVAALLTDRAAAAAWDGASWRSLAPWPDAGSHRWTCMDLSADGSTLVLGSYYSPHFDNWYAAAGAEECRARAYRWTPTADDPFEGSWVQVGGDVETALAGGNELVPQSVAASADGRAIAVGSNGYENHAWTTMKGRVEVYDLVDGAWSPQPDGADINGVAKGSLSAGGLRGVEINADASVVAAGAFYATDSGSIRVYEHAPRPTPAPTPAPTATPNSPAPTVPSTPAPTATAATTAPLDAEDLASYEGEIVRLETGSSCVEVKVGHYVGYSPGDCDGQANTVDYGTYDASSANKKKVQHYTGGDLCTTCEHLESCFGYWCDYWTGLEGSSHTCNSLDWQFGCDCDGCSCTKPPKDATESTLELVPTSQLAAGARELSFAQVDGCTWSFELRVGT
ncbi:hypothetical protein JL720_6294 [Aureococcus anophagefferens]|nr:hypothetical protein JL720_6294 [Aureococcus anophagefferens]